mmetsp:Transcript_68644/g.223339  ORF Transcript_68644/g.223339 Transcript_68644/m.223339 type:complete len:210 (-) Transcript_68644:1858-2487(-)
MRQSCAPIGVFALLKLPPTAGSRILIFLILQIRKRNCPLLNPPRCDDRAQLQLLILLTALEAQDRRQVPAQRPLESGLLAEVSREACKQDAFRLRRWPLFFTALLSLRRWLFLLRINLLLFHWFRRWSPQQLDLSEKDLGDQVWRCQLALAQSQQLLAKRMQTTRDRPIRLLSSRQRHALCQHIAWLKQGELKLFAQAPLNSGQHGRAT